MKLQSMLWRKSEPKRSKWNTLISMKYVNLTYKYLGDNVEIISEYLTKYFE